MSASSNRVRVLGLIVGVLAVVVVIDQVRPRSSEDGDAGSPRARYLDAAKVVEAKRALVSHADEWAATVASARAAWGEILPKLIKAPTPDLALAGFRDEVLNVVDGFEIPTKKVASLTATPIAGAPGLQVLEVRLEVETYSVPDVIRLVDRLENMPNRVTGVVEARLDGPGQNTADVRRVVAVIVVRSIGLVGEGGAT